MGITFLHHGIRPGLDTATTAWVAAVIANGGTVSDPRKTIVDNLIVGLKADGIFSKCDRLWLHAAENQPSALTDIIANSLATAVNSPAFAPNRGYTGQDSANPTKYIDSNYNAFTQGVSYSLNAASVSSWSTTNNPSSNGGAVLGNRDSVNGVQTEIFDTFTDGNVYARLNDQSTPSGSQGAPSTREGHWFLNRSSSAATQLYQNGSSFSSPNGTAFSSLANGNFYILADNLLGTGAETGTPNQIAMTSFGGNFSATDVTKFYARLVTYMAAVFTQAWVDTVVTNGGTVSAGRQTLVNSLISGLMTDGVWYKLDRLWLLAAENSQSALTDLVYGGLSTASGSPTFTTDRGYAGVDASPTTKFIQTDYQPSSTTLFSTNAGHISAWCVGNVASVSVSGSLIGHLTSTAETSIYDTDNAAGNVYGRLNDSPSSGAQGVPSSRQGLWLINRSGASASQLYNNGTLFSNPNGTAAAASAVTNLAILGVWNQSGANVFSGTPNQVAAATAGGNLTATDVSNLYTRLRTYMTAVGVP